MNVTVRAAGALTAGRVGAGGACMARLSPLSRSGRGSRGPPCMLHGVTAASVGAPCGPRAVSTWDGLRPDRGGRGAWSSGESRPERQYRGDPHHDAGQWRAAERGRIHGGRSVRAVCGIDWATASHQICLLRPDGRREDLGVAHTGAGLAQLRQALQQRVTAPARIAVAIEVPRGAMVDIPARSGAVTSTRLIPSSSTASAIGTRWPAPKTIAATGPSWLGVQLRTDRRGLPSARDRRRPKSSSCAN